MKKRTKRYINNLIFILFFGLSVFSAGYLYLDNSLNGVSVSQGQENVPYYEPLPQDTTVLFKICEDNYLINLKFSEKSIGIIFAENITDEAQNIFGYDIDYRLNGNYKIVGYLTDAVGGIEFNNKRYTGVQITEMLEYTDVSKETKKVIAEKIVNGIAERGFSKEDMLNIIENTDTNLKFASAYPWTQYISELCEFPIIIF